MKKLIKASSIIKEIKESSLSTDFDNRKREVINSLLGVIKEVTWPDEWSYTVEAQDLPHSMKDHPPVGVLIKVRRNPVPRLPRLYEVVVVTYYFDPSAKSRMSYSFGRGFGETVSTDFHSSSDPRQDLLRTFKSLYFEPHMSRPTPKLNRVIDAELLRRNR
jgi:hypothetical protein